MESEFFMYTNTYWAVRKHVDLLLTDDGKPLVSYIYSDLPFCSDYPACNVRLRLCTEPDTPS